jgi:hypothetical protein
VDLISTACRTYVKAAVRVASRPSTLPVRILQYVRQEYAAHLRISVVLEHFAKIVATILTACLNYVMGFAIRALVILVQLVMIAITITATLFQRSVRMERGLSMPFVEHPKTANRTHAVWESVNKATEVPAQWAQIVLRVCALALPPHASMGLFMIHAPNLQTAYRTCAGVACV